MVRKHICTLGYHNPDGARHWVIRTGLEEHGYVFHECITHKKGFVRKYCDLIRQFWRVRHTTDVILVPFPGHYVMPLAWLLGFVFRKPVVFDVFISLYDTMVEDRGLIKKRSVHASFVRWLDWLSCTLADIVVLDTPEHCAYFTEQYSIAPTKLVTALIGARTDLFHPSGSSHSSEQCKVVFHGTFIPLQGIDTILHAAKILQDQDPEIQIVLVGSGQTYDHERQLATSLQLDTVHFVGTVPLSDIPKHIADADMCLGIFGTTQKTLRVIPHKAYEILACKKPLITADTPASRAFLTHNSDAYLVSPGNAEELADAILKLKSDPSMRDAIAKNGYRLFLEKCAPRTIVRLLETHISQSFR